jgi:hypothetical protein
MNAAGTTVRHPRKRRCNPIGLPKKRAKSKDFPNLVQKIVGIRLEPAHQRLCKGIHHCRGRTKFRYRFFPSQLDCTLKNGGPGLPLASDKAQATETPGFPITRE